MQIIYFNGRIYPENTLVSFSELPEVTLKMPGIQPEAKLTINIYRSELHVICRFDSAMDFNPWLNEIRNYIEDHVKSPVDFLGFLMGTSLCVEIKSCIFLGETKPFYFSRFEPHVAGMVKFSELTSDEDSFNQVVSNSINLAINNEHLRLALADCRRAIQEPAYTAMYCYKAIENIRVYFQKKPKKSSKKEQDTSWISMLQRMNIDVKSKDKLFTKGGAPRHGVVPYITAEERNIFMKFTWEVIERFIIYRLNNDTGLDFLTYKKIVIKD